MHVIRCAFCSASLYKPFNGDGPMHCPSCGDVPISFAAFHRARRPLGRYVLEELRERGLGNPDSREITQSDIEDIRPGGLHGIMH